MTLQSLHGGPYNRTPLQVYDLGVETTAAIYIRGCLTCVPSLSHFVTVKGIFKKSL